METNKKYVFSILKIIFLTNIPAFAFLPSHFYSGIGWILGSLGSAINFYLMARSTLALQPISEKANSIKTSKSTLLRMLFLIGWCLFVMIVIKPELVTFGLGLLATQFSIFMHHIYIVIRYGKLKQYFERGKDE